MLGAIHMLKTYESGEVAQACDPNTRRLRQKDCKVKAGLGYIVPGYLYLQKMFQKQQNVCVSVCLSVCLTFTQELVT